MINKVKYDLFILVLLTSALIIISLSIYSMKSSHKLIDIDAPLVDAAMEVKLELALAHLKFEKRIAGDHTITLDQVYSHIEKSKWFAEAMLYGGQNSEGTYLPLEDTSSRTKILIVLEEIVNIQKQINLHLSEIDRAPTGRPLDQSFNRTFENAFKEADEVENALLLYLASERNSQKATDYIILIISVLLYMFVILYTVSQRNRELSLIKKLGKMATQDKLTGIPNRRFFDDTLANEWTHALRGKTPISIVLCDIDFFKKYNDALGHQAGDDCLKQVADVMNGILQRPIDNVARYGGEEFAFIFPFTDADGAKIRIDVLQRALKKQAIPHPESEVSDYITISAGVASVIPDATQSYIDLITKADQALYFAKDKGRDQTVMASSA